MMKTPICDFVKKYAEDSALRLHMPGHKGKPYLGIEQYDITEIDGADVLYHSRGIIRESEQNAADLFGTAKTLYSAEGSSLSIRAMLYLAKLYGDNPLILAGRNAHKTFITASVLLDLDVEWMYPSENILSCEISAKDLENALSSMQKKPAAVYITSPDYLGNIADIASLSAVCKKHGILLLVDNAHGAYLRFLPEDIHPITLGADLCCDSAHKTLPVLTGGGYLHISKTAPTVLENAAERAMALFASTSPSYLVLQSLDAANGYIADGYKEKLSAFAKKVSSLRKRLENTGYRLVGSEPMKLTLAPKSYGYTGNGLAEKLQEQGIVCEFSDPDFTVMMLTPEIGESGLCRLEKALLAVEKRAEITDRSPTIAIPQKKMSARCALFSRSSEREVEECCGKTLADAAVACPPAVPIVISGEVIDEHAIACFKYYGINTLHTVDE